MRRLQALPFLLPIGCCLCAVAWDPEWPQLLEAGWQPSFRRRADRASGPTGRMFSRTTTRLRYRSRRCRSSNRRARPFRLAVARSITSTRADAWASGIRRANLVTPQHRTRRPAGRSIARQHACQSLTHPAACTRTGLQAKICGSFTGSGSGSAAKEHHECSGSHSGYGGNRASRVRPLGCTCRCSAGKGCC
jgi:hypothetical protein